MHANALAIDKECEKQGNKVVVVGVPKTIDNDILFMDWTFGFNTTIGEVQKSSAWLLAKENSVYNGIGIVKLMDKQSDFIAIHSSFASNQMDV